MFASFSIITGGDAHSAPGVPESAVVYEGDTARVWVARDDTAVALRGIRTGRVAAAAWSRCWPGLQPGEQIVTSGTLFIDRAAQGD